MAVSSASRKFGLGLSLVLYACSAYDAGLLNSVRSNSGAVGGSGSTMAAVTGGSGGRGAGGTGALGSGGGTDVTVSRPDAGDATRCGDGMVTGAETCDMAIAKDAPGACPIDCPPLAECVLRALNGTLVAIRLG